MNKHHVAILGCGPAGLLCAWAVEQAGHVPHIISRKQKSVIPGSQHLHGSVPGLTSPYPEGVIQFIRLGTAKEYARKVYKDSERPTGWDNYYQQFPSWNVILAYDRLWAHFHDRIDDEELPGEGGWERMREITLGYRLVISTLPAQTLCHADHTFRGSKYWIETLPTPPADEAHELVVYNGLPKDKWYRWSILGGICSQEFADPPEVLMKGNGPVSLAGNAVRSGTKAIETDCDCWPAIQRAGRWAEWRHGVVMHDAYLKAARLAEQI